MSGIAGMIRWDGQAPAHADVALMAGLMSHRGEGSATVATLDGARFAGIFRSLHDRGSQAPVCAHLGVLVAADCRLYNRKELIKQLMPEKSRLDISDAELLAEGYRAWTDDLPSRLDGEFAFAIWDAANRRFFAARDPFGAKPCFLLEQPWGLAFASEPKQLLCLPGVRAEPDPLIVAEYLFLRFQEFDRTFFKGVRRLLPAHFASADGPRVIAQHRWWHPPLEEVVRFGDHESYFHHFRELLEQAIDKRLDTDFAVGCHLSGGLDSGSIVLLADQLYRRCDRERPRLETISAKYLQPDCNEGPQIEAVVRATRFKNHAFDADGPGLFKDLAAMQWQADRPFADPGHSTFVETNAVMKAIGARSLLMGFGGDELTTEGWYTHDLAERGQWRRVWRELRGIDSVGASHWSLARMAYDTVKSIVPSRWKTSLRQAIGMAHWTPPAFAQPDLVALFLSHRDKEFVTRSGHASKTQYMIHRNLMYPENTSLVELYEARGAYAGHEPKLPFLDRTLAEYVLSIPFDVLIDAPKWKGLIRRGLADLLPEEVTRRRLKVDLNAYVINAVSREKDAVLKDLGPPGSWACQPYVDPYAAHALIEAKMPVDTRRIGQCATVFRLLCLEIWLRNMVAYQRV